MLSYIIGKIISNNKISITVESNWSGYVINVSDPTKFEIGKIRKIYLYKHSCLSNKNAVVDNLYGFYTYDEKEMFLKLIGLQGIGPKTAMQIMRNDVNLLKNLINSKDVKGLTSLSSISEKIAKQMIDNIEVDTKNISMVPSKMSEVVSALRTLGYEKNEIDYAIVNKEIVENQKLDVSDLISLAIKTIATNKENGGIIKTK